MYRTCRYSNHIIQEFKIWKSWFDFLNFCLLLDFYHVIAIKEVHTHLRAFFIFLETVNFWRKIWKFNDLLPKFWQFPDTGRNRKILFVDIFKKRWCYVILLKKWNLEKATLGERHTIWPVSVVNSIFKSLKNLIYQRSNYVRGLTMKKWYEW